MNKDPLGYYAWLGLTPEATVEEVKTAFRARARRLHPDVSGTGDADAFRKLSEAYHILSDAARRARYDRTAIAPDIFVNAAAQTAPPSRRRPSGRSRRRKARNRTISALGFCIAIGMAGLIYWADQPSPPDPSLFAPDPDPDPAPLAGASPAGLAPGQGSEPLPALDGDPTHYVLPGPGPAVLWAGVPGEHLERLGVVPPFTPVHAKALIVDGLQAISLANGHLAYMDAARLMPGDEQDSERARCAYVAGVPPANGEVLTRGESGSARLIIVNREPSSAVVTLSKNGAVAARVFLGPEQQAAIAGLPSGPWSAMSAFGELWSRGCGGFVADRRDGLLAPLVPPDRPLVISADS